MPLVRVSLRQGKSDDYKKAIGDGVYRAMREVFNVPEEDRFVVVSEHSESEFQFSKTYLDIARSDDLVIIQITANNTRTTEQKKALFAKIAELLSRHRGDKRQASPQAPRTQACQFSMPGKADAFADVR